MPGLQNTDQRSLEFLTWIQKTIRRKPLPSLNIILLELIKLLWRSPYISGNSTGVMKYSDCTNFFEHQLKWNTGSRDSKNSTITNNWKSKFDGEENLFTDSCDFYKKNVKFSRITRKKIEYFHHHHTSLVIGSQQSEGEGEKTS